MIIWKNTVNHFFEKFLWEQNPSRHHHGATKKVEKNPSSNDDEQENTLHLDCACK